MAPSKRQKTTHSTDEAEKAAALEKYLFGRPTSSAAAHQGPNLIEEQAPLSLAWEDRAGALAPKPMSDDSGEEEDVEDEDASPADGQRGDFEGQSSGRDSSESEESGSEDDGFNPLDLKSLLYKHGYRGDESDGSEDVRRGRMEDSDTDDEGRELKQPEEQGRTTHAGTSVGAVWEDPADAEVEVDVSNRNRLRKLRREEEQRTMKGEEYERALRQQHAALNPRTSWTKLKGSRRRQAAEASGSEDEEGRREGEDDDGTTGSGGVEELLRSAGGLLSIRQGGVLPPGLIETTRVKDANMHAPCQGVVKSVEFHPGGQLLMTASLDKRLRFFQVDGLRNPKVQSVFLEDCPIHQAAFAGEGAQVVAAGRRSHFYIYDINGAAVERVGPPAGRRGERSLESFAVSPVGVGGGDALVAFLGDQGYLPLVSLKSRQWVGNIKMNGSARCAVFSADGNQLVTLGSDGVLYTWELRTRRCLSREVDEGCIGPSALALSSDSRYLASGSSAGVVNLYRCGAQRAACAARQGVLERVKELMNLTTTVDSLAFSPDAQILAMASRMKRDALRLVHLPSATVFSNWPTARSPLHYVHSMAFSPNGGFLAVGNAKGRTLLYRLHHYADV